MQKQKRTNNKPSKKAKKINSSRNMTAVSVPAARSFKVTTRQPVIKAAGSSVRISHREYLSELSGNNNFAVLDFPVNPGLPTFPWLSGIAQRYEFYSIRSMSVHYVPRCSTSAAGTVVLAIDRDVKDANPSDFRSIMSYEGAQSSVPWNSIILRARATSQKLFVRMGEPEIGTDQRMYDWGKILIASLAPSPTLFGDVYLEYDIEFSVPEVHNEVNLGVTSLKTEGTSDYHRSAKGTEEVVQVLEEIVDAVGDAGIPIPQAREGFRKSFQNMAVKSVLKPVSYTVKSTPDNDSRYYASKRQIGLSEVRAIVLPKGRYHFAFSGIMTFKRNSGTETYFTLVSDQTAEASSGLGPAGGLLDLANSTSTFENVVIQCRAWNPVATNWSISGVTNSRILYRSPVVLNLIGAASIVCSVEFDIELDPSGTNPAVAQFTAPGLDFFTDTYNIGLYCADIDALKWEITKLAETD